MNANDLFKSIMELDLQPIKTKLMHVASGEGWSRSRADAVEIEYRRFLCLMKTHPNEERAPLVDVDTFWHYHILDTMKYAADCETTFGYFLHHDPYAGMGDDNDQKSHPDGGNRVLTAWCASPGRDKLKYQAARVTAWCASPGRDKLTHAAAHAAAWCASPGRDKLTRAASNATPGSDNREVRADLAA